MLNDLQKQVPRFNFLAIIFYNNKKRLPFLNHQVGNISVNTDTQNAGLFSFLVQGNEYYNERRQDKIQFCKKSML